MDYEKCLALITSIEMGSFSAASEKLKYTTSAISKMINSIESELGLVLLVRGRNGVYPTKNCIEMIPVFKEIIYWNSQCFEMADDIKGIKRGSISVGTAYGIYYKWISNLISKFNEEYPFIKVNLIEGTSTNLSRSVENKEADFCIISQRNGDYDWIKLFDDELLAMLPKSHYYADKEYYPIDEFLRESFIEIFPGQETDNSRVFKLNNIDIKASTRFSTVDSNAASHLVEANLGVSLVNSLVAKSIDADVIYKSIEPKQIVEIGIAFPDKNIISPSARCFVEFSKKYLSGLYM